MPIPHRRRLLAANTIKLLFNLVTWRWASAALPAVTRFGALMMSNTDFLTAARRLIIISRRTLWLGSGDSFFFNRAHVWRGLLFCSDCVCIVIYSTNYFAQYVSERVSADRVFDDVMGDVRWTTLASSVGLPRNVCLARKVSAIKSEWRLHRDVLVLTQKMYQRYFYFHN